MNRTTMTAVSTTLLLALAGAASAQCDSRWVRNTDPQTGDKFGTALALTSQWLAVGAPEDDNDKGTNAGAAYVFARVGSAYVQVFHAVPTTSNVVGGAGWDVGITDKHLLVGHRDPNGLQGGATVFKQTSGIWAQQATLTPANLNANDRFGEAVAISGVTAIVGAPGDDTTGPNSGAVHFFTEINGTWTPGGAMTLFNNDNALIGSAVAIDGTIAVVGAPGRQVSGHSNAGTAYIVRQGLGWNLSQTLTDPEVVHANERFGAAVAISGDLVVIGAPQADTATQQDVGTVYLYERINNTFQYFQRIPAPDGDYSNDFGTSVAISGDVLAVGATSGAGPKTYYFRRAADGLYKFEAVYSNTTGYSADVAAQGSTIVSGHTNYSFAGYPATSGGVQSIVVPSFNGANQWWNAPAIDVPGSYTGCTSGATTNGNASCGSSSNSPDVWYTFTAPATGSIWVDTIGSDYDTVLSIHALGQPFTSLVCNDDIAVGSIRDSRVTMSVIQGAQYLIRVSGFNTASGKFNLNIRMQCPADLTTAAVAGQAGYGIPNGQLNSEDFFYYLAQYAAGNLGVCDLTNTAVPGTPGYGQPNNILNSEDFFYYLAAYAAGC